MTIPEKPKLPDGAGASQARNPDQALSDASLKNVTGGAGDLPGVGEAIERLKTMPDAMKKKAGDL